MPTLIRVPNYGHFDIGGQGDKGWSHIFETPYNHLYFCEMCHGMMPDGYYLHLGMKHCPWCGTEFLTEMRANEPIPHPLILEENERRQAERRKRDLEDIEKRGCPNCLIPLDGLGKHHKAPTKSEHHWNPRPLGAHTHKFCGCCGYEQIWFVLTDGGELYAWNPDEPPIGPLAPRSDG